MAGFLYFVPGCENECAVRLKFAELGLDEVFGEVGITVARVGNSPSGEAGCIVMPHVDLNPDPGYFPDSQTWMKAPGGKHWIGFETARRPSPTCLERRETVAGHYVRLEDGNDWLVPAARVFYGGGTCLPEVFSLGPNGEIVKAIVPRYKALSKQAESLWEDFTSEAANGALRAIRTQEDSLRLACEALAVNYHVGLGEVLALELTSTAGMREILRALIDYPSFLRAVESIEAGKKKDSLQPGIAGSLNTDVGAAVNSEIISPPLECSNSGDSNGDTSDGGR